MRGAAVCVLGAALGCASTTSAQRSDGGAPSDVAAVDAVRDAPANARRFIVRVESIDRLGAVTPLAGAAVALDRGDDARRLQATEADGSALFSDVLSGSVDVTVANRGHIARSLLGVEVTDEGLVVRLESIGLPPSRTVRGAVRGLLAPDDEVILTLSTYGERLLTAPTQYEMEIPVASGGVMVAGLLSHDRIGSSRWIRFDFSENAALAAPLDLDFATATESNSAGRMLISLSNPPAPLSLARVDCSVTGADGMRSTLALSSFQRVPEVRPDAAQGVLVYPDGLLPESSLATFCRAIYPTSVAGAAGAFSVRYFPGASNASGRFVTLPALPSPLPNGLRSGSTFVIPSPAAGVRHNVRVIGFPGVRTWEIELAAGATSGRIPALPSAMLASSILSDGPTAQLTACEGARNDPSCRALSGSARTRFNR